MRGYNSYVTFNCFAKAYIEKNPDVDKDDLQRSCLVIDDLSRSCLSRR